MYHSTFLVNRQMITEPSQIKSSLERYLSKEGGPIKGFFYRLEWYRIGISIPMDVYSEKMPLFQLRPECQLTHSEKLSKLTSDVDEIKFKLFAIPYKRVEKNEDLDLEFFKKWFQKKIKGVASLVSLELGPNNRIYYKQKPNDTSLSQIQSYSLKGVLKCIDVEKLEALRQKPLGYYDNLGCGLLMLE